MAKKQLPIEKPAFLLKVDAVINFVARVAFYLFLLGIPTAIAMYYWFPTALAYVLSAGYVSAFVYVLIHLCHGMMSQAFEMSLEARANKEKVEKKNDIMPASSKPASKKAKKGNVEEVSPVPPMYEN